MLRCRYHRPLPSLTISGERRIPRRIPPGERTTRISTMPGETSGVASKLREQMSFSWTMRLTISTDGEENKGRMKERKREGEGRNSWFELGMEDREAWNVIRAIRIFRKGALWFTDNARWIFTIDGKPHPFLFERRNKLDLTIRCTSFRLKTFLSYKIG